jgi:hypothetical protein
MLRTDKLDLVRPSLLSVVNIIMMLSTSNEYKRSLLLNLGVWEYQRQEGLPMHEMLQNQMGLVNEEDGEITFGGFGRLVIGDTQQSKVGHMQKMFSLLPLFKETVSDFEEDLCVSGGANGRKTFSPQGEHCLAIGSFLMKWIKLVVRRRLMVFDHRLVYGNHGSGFIKMDEESAFWRITPLIYKEDLTDAHRIAKQKACLVFDTYFGQDEEHVWSCPANDVDWGVVGFDACDDESSDGSSDMFMGMPSDLDGSEGSDVADAGDDIITNADSVDHAVVNDIINVLGAADVLETGASITDLTKQVRVAAPDEDDEPIDAWIQNEEDGEGIQGSEDEEKEPEDGVVVGYIERIVGEKMTRGHLNYLIKWEGESELQWHNARLIKQDSPASVAHWNTHKVRQGLNKRRRRQQDPGYKPI